MGPLKSIYETLFPVQVFWLFALFLIYKVLFVYDSNILSKINVVLFQQNTSNVEEIRAKPEYHKFLIGRGGSKIRKVNKSLIFVLLL
jgi:hypothetical protein